jgi:phosphoserine aminotransferase
MAGERVWNFSAGPAMLPPSVLARAQRDLVSLPDVGVSPLEISHRSPWFEGVIGEAERNLRALLAIPDSHRVVFVQGGASMQFSMAAMNLLRGGGTAEYVLTGAWGAKAAAEATKEGPIRILWSGEDGRFVRVPRPDECTPSPGAAYVHVTANETIQGVEWPPGAEPRADTLVCDASSDFLSRPVDLARYGLLYAGAQKNAGPAGVTVAVVREDLLERIPDGLPSTLDYRTYVRHGSMYNTPPVFAIYVVLLVTRWLRDEVGGLARQQATNERKAALLYAEIDGSDGFYRGHAAPDSRSRMNVTWRLPGEDLEVRFVTEAAGAGLIELKGHRSVGGIRASIYNAMPTEGAEVLAAFMRDFARRNG